MRSIMGVSGALIFFKWVFRRHGPFSLLTVRSDMK